MLWSLVRVFSNDKAKSQPCPNCCPTLDLTAIVRYLTKVLVLGIWEFFLNGEALRVCIIFGI